MIETRSRFGPLENDVLEDVREEVLQRLDLVDDDTFIQEITITPEGTEVKFEDHS